MVKRIKLETKSEEKSERTKEQDTGNKTDAIKIYKFRNLFTYEELEADGEFEDALCMYRFCTMLQEVGQFKKGESVNLITIFLDRMEVHIDKEVDQEGSSLVFSLCVGFPNI